VSSRAHRARSRRRGEAGLTLIDTLVAIAIMSVSIVVIVGGFANAARSASIATDQANLEATMNHLTDWVRSPSIPYKWCADPNQTLAQSYSAAIVANPPLQGSGPDAVPIPANVVTAAIHASSMTRTNAAVTNPGGLLQLQCTDGNDWGVQRLTLTLTSSSGRTLSQVLYKSAGLAVPPQNSIPLLACAHPPLTTGEPEIFDVNGQKNQPANIIPPAGTPITVGTTIGAYYTDEKDLNQTTAPPLITVDNLQRTPTIAVQPKNGNLFVYKITYTLQQSDNLAVNTQHTVIVQACDGDQNKSGGDYGSATFTFTLQQ
jgi:type II secretory pathway pseudopilin PulG